MGRTRVIARGDWSAFFEGLSDAAIARWIEVDTAFLQLEGRMPAPWAPLLGVSYEWHDDLLSIALSGVQHRIRHPREIHVDEGPRGIERVTVTAEHGSRQVLRFRDPLMLVS